MNTSCTATLAKRLHAVAETKGDREPAVRTLDSETALSVVDAESVDRAILRLNAICRLVTMDFALAVGKVVVDSLHLRKSAIVVGTGREEHLVSNARAAPGPSHESRCALPERGDL